MVTSHAPASSARQGPGHGEDALTMGVVLSVLVAIPHIVAASRMPLDASHHNGLEAHANVMGSNAALIMDDGLAAYHISAAHDIDSSHILVMDVGQDNPFDPAGPSNSTVPVIYL
ncbi:hypothetical protein B0T19DRAFT_442804 [Cercophora scortea]|uniref:Uncharacterized protein n=1 Tax=Cercophora scortea TaxID=314031 RepID=A0AAE0IDX6_9PEZI|nr:hypothetical protein B0T19DRAFT_442804 [Cercophora scortea]